VTGPYRAYDPDSGDWYTVDRPGTPLDGTQPVRSVQVGLPDGTVAQRPAAGLRRHREGEDTYRS
jgi:hypothetical protein